MQMIVFGLSLILIASGSQVDSDIASDENDVSFLQASLDIHKTAVPMGIAQTACPGWCETSPKDWSTLCTWGACAVCSQCTPTPAPPVTVNCASDPLALQAVLTGPLSDGLQILVDPDYECKLDTEVVVKGVNGLEIACHSNDPFSKCQGATVVASSALATSKNALVFKTCSNVNIQGITFDGIGVQHTPSAAGNYANISYINCKFYRSPATSLNFYFWQSQTFRASFSNILVHGCTFEEMGGPGLTIISWPEDGSTDANKDTYDYTEHVTITDNVMINAWTDARDAANQTPESAPGVILNRVKHCTATGNTFVRMAGSGLWTVQTYDLVFSHNLIAHSRRVTDACANHVDIQNDDSVFEYNIGYKNEGGFFESMGLSDNNVARYCVSVDDGQEHLGDGERIHHANTIFLTGYTAELPRAGPTNVSLHNNLIISTDGATQYYRFIDSPLDIHLANNEFIVGSTATHIGGIELYKSEGKYNPDDFSAPSNLVGGDDKTWANFVGMFAPNDPETNQQLPDADSTEYADLIGSIVSNYVDGDGNKDASTLTFNELRTLICDAVIPDAVQQSKGQMTATTQGLDGRSLGVGSAADFCGTQGTQAFVGAIRPPTSSVLAAQYQDVIRKAVDRVEAYDD